MKNLKKICIIIFTVMIFAVSIPSTNASAKVAISKSKQTLYVGQSLKLKVTGTKSTVKWSTSNKKVATVSKGKVVAKKAGTAKITAKVGKKSYVCKVTVKNLSLTKTNLVLNEGKTKSIKLTGAYKTVKWSTSNKAVATVSNGKIKAVKAGTATIKAKHNGKTYSCKVTVKSVFNSSTGISKISYNSYKVSDGVFLIAKNNYSYSMSVTAKITYFDANGKVIFTTSDDNFCFEPNSTSTFYFTNPYDTDYNDVPYSKYKISFSVDQASYRTPNSRDIRLSGNIGSNDFIVSTKNVGKIKSDSTCIAVVYYSNGLPVYYVERYVDTSNIGGTTYTNFTLPYDSNYEDIEFDNYKLFIKYSFKWSF